MLPADMCLSVQPICLSSAGSWWNTCVLPVIESLIAAGHYRLTDIFRRTRTRYISLPETEFERKTVRNIHVRGKPVRVSILECFLKDELPGQEKCFLIVRMINGFIRNDKKNSEYRMEMQ